MCYIFHFVQMVVYYTWHLAFFPLIMSLGDASIFSIKGCFILFNSNKVFHCVV